MTIEDQLHEWHRSFLEPEEGEPTYEDEPRAFSIYFDNKYSYVTELSGERAVYMSEEEEFIFYPEHFYFDEYEKQWDYTIKQLNSDEIMELAQILAWAEIEGGK